MKERYATDPFGGNARVFHDGPPVLASMIEPGDPPSSHPAAGNGNAADLMGKFTLGTDYGWDDLIAGFGKTNWITDLYQGSGGGGGGMYSPDVGYTASTSGYTGDGMAGYYAAAPSVVASPTQSPGSLLPASYLSALDLWQPDSAVNPAPDADTRLAMYLASNGFSIASTTTHGITVLGSDPGLFWAVEGHNRAYRQYRAGEVSLDSLRGLGYRPSDFGLGEISLRQTGSETSSLTYVVAGAGFLMGPTAAYVYYTGLNVIDAGVSLYHGAPLGATIKNAALNQTLMYAARIGFKSFLRNIVPKMVQSGAPAVGTTIVNGPHSKILQISERNLQVEFPTNGWRYPAA